MKEDCPPSISYFATPDFLALACHVISVIEIPFHLLGAYCILTKTPKKMRNAKMSLLTLHLLTVIFGIVTGFLVTPYVFLPAMALVPLGLLSMFHVPPTVQFYIWCTSYTTTAVGILTIFENRYYHISKNLKWAKLRKYCLTFNYISAVTFYIYPLSQVPEQEHVRKVVLERLPCLVNISNLDPDTIFVLSLDATLPIILNVSMATFIITQIVIFVIVTSRKIMVDRQHLSKNTCEMQRKFLIAIIGQFGIYIVVYGFPALLVAYLLTVGSFNQVVNNLIYITLSLYGLISTTSMITFHNPYREWVFKKCGMHKTEVSRTSNTQMSFVVMGS